MRLSEVLSAIEAGGQRSQLLDGGMPAGYRVQGTGCGMPEGCPLEWQRIVRLCLQHDPRRRPAIQEVLRTLVDGVSA